MLITRALAILLASLLQSPPPAAPAATTPAETAATQPAISPEADAWLDRVTAQAGKTANFIAKVRYDRKQGLVNDRQRRFGTIIYQAGPPARFNVRFDRLLVDNRADNIDLAFVFDGRWLAERDATQKRFTRRQLVADDAPPEQADPLALGEGPFVLPITRDKSRIVKRFNVTLVEPNAKNDPPGRPSVHLQLEPRPGQRTDFTRIDLWYDRENLTPLRAATLDESENESIIDLTNVRTDEAPEKGSFDTAEPRGEGWRVEIAPRQQP